MITCYLWGVLHFSETLKAKHQLAQSLFPNFLEYSRFVRRCNALLPSIQLIRQALVFKEVEGIDVSKYLTLVHFSVSYQRLDVILAEIFPSSKSTKHF